MWCPVGPTRYADFPAISKIRDVRDLDQSQHNVYGAFSSAALHVTVSWRLTMIILVQWILYESLIGKNNFMVADT